MIERDDDGKEIKLPPMPDDAIEFGVKKDTGLESFIDQTGESAEDFKNLSEQSIVDNDESERNLSLSDLVAEEPVIVSDPMPTPSDPEHEFNPANTQNALDDFDEEGGARKAVVPGATLPESKAKIITLNEIDIGNKESTFNPGTIQNALVNSDVEGGIVTNKSTGSMKTANGDSANDGKQIKSSDPALEEKMYRVYGFIVQFEHTNSAGEKITVTKEISDFFEDETSAMISVNGKKYLMPGKNKTFNIVNIVSGVPCISHQDRNIYTYTGDKIGAGGYWKRG